MTRNMSSHVRILRDTIVCVPAWAAGPGERVIVLEAAAEHGMVIEHHADGNVSAVTPRGDVVLTYNHAVYNGGSLREAWEITCRPDGLEAWSCGFGPCTPIEVITATLRAVLDPDGLSRRLGDLPDRRSAAA